MSVPNSADEKAVTMSRIYLKTMEESLRYKTKRWLVTQGFPPMPVYFASFLRRPVRHHRFKMKIIGELKRSWKNISIGIGDRDSDARVYLANGAKPIILRAEGHAPSGAVTVSNWRDVRQLLLG